MKYEVMKYEVIKYDIIKIKKPSFLRLCPARAYTTLVVLVCVRRRNWYFSPKDLARVSARGTESCISWIKGRSGCKLHSFQLLVTLYNLVRLYFIFVSKKLSKIDCLLISVLYTSEYHMSTKSSIPCLKNIKIIIWMINFESIACYFDLLVTLLYNTLCLLLVDADIRRRYFSSIFFLNNPEI